MSDAAQPEPVLSQQEQSDLRRALDGFAGAGEEPLRLFVALIDQLRLGCAGDIARIAARYSFFLTQLEHEAPYREAVRERIIDLFEGLSQVSFYTDAGILPNTGFFSELWRRIVHRVLPDVHSPHLMQDAIAAIFHWKKDYLWLDPAQGGTTGFWRLIHPLETPRKDTLWRTLDQLLEALQVLAVRVAAMGMDPELLRIMPDLARHGSPFLGLSAETQRFVDAYRSSFADDAIVPQDENHLLVLIDQCREATERAEKKASKLGTSLRLTYILVRLGQSLKRIKLFARLLGSAAGRADEIDITQLWSVFFREAVMGLNRRNSIRSHIAGLIGLLALRVTENASVKGEHYIAADRREYGLMFRAAAGAGLLIGSMALLKVLGAKAQLAPLLQAGLYSMIYAVCFVTAYMLHFTIATKQPAMTAATLAASIGGAKPGRRKWDDVAALTVNTARSQLAAIAGNVLVAFPTALAVLLAADYCAGHSLVSPEKTGHLLHDLHPLHSLALVHAAIAGCYLFLSGLITGYFDNRAAYVRIRERVAALRWLRRLFGAARADRIGAYLHDHLGGLMGNALFGLMLGSTGVLGQIAGLPLDIRHIAFSAANLAYALVALDFRLPAEELLWCVLGVALIGVINLVVSFSLALWTALKSRGIDRVPYLEILQALWRKFLAEPLTFFRIPAERS
jgi:site-specific recombinase